MIIRAMGINEVPEKDCRERKGLRMDFQRTPELRRWDMEANPVKEQSDT